MPAVVDGHHAEAHLLGLVDSDLHRLGHDDYPQAAVRVYGGGSGSFADDSPVGPGVELALAVPVHVVAEHVRHPVRVHATDVGRDENVGGNFAVRARHPHLGEYLSDGVSEWRLVDPYRVRLLDLELV